MSQNKTIQVAGLDYQDIKESLKTFLKADDTFRDWNFDGSGLNYLISILAANTHWMALFANLIANEGFIDTAQQRSTLVSLAKHLAYTPQSQIGAIATVNITIDASSLANPPTQWLLTRTDGPFTATWETGTYKFYPLESVTTNYNSVDKNYVFNNVRIKEGYWASQTYQVDWDNPDIKFLIPDANADLTTLIVKVQNSITDTTQTRYNAAANITTITDTDTVYWTQEYRNGQFEVYFGNDVIGARPANSSLVILEYMITNGDAANDIGSVDTAYSPAFTASISSLPTTITVARSSNDDTVITGYAQGGAVAEDLESIRFLAPKNYEMQNRTVTESDYETLILRDYPSVEAVSVWGGEKNVPPQYGKVFISLKPLRGFIVTQAQKDYISNSLIRKMNVVTVLPEYVDPDYIFIEVSTKVQYNIKDEIPSNTIKLAVLNAIANYGTEELEQFHKTMRYSQFCRAIDDSHTSIISNITRLRLQKRFTPRTDIASDYVLNFGNSIDQVKGSTGVLFSSYFLYYDPVAKEAAKCTFEDDGNGNIRIIRGLTTGGTRVINPRAGVIDYFNGILALYRFKPLEFTDDYIKATATPSVQDISSVRNQILVIDPAIEITPSAITVR